VATSARPIPRRRQSGRTINQCTTGFPSGGAPREASVTLPTSSEVPSRSANQNELGDHHGFAKNSVSNSACVQLRTPSFCLANVRSRRCNHAAISSGPVNDRILTSGTVVGMGRSVRDRVICSTIGMGVILPDKQQPAQRSAEIREALKSSQNTEATLSIHLKSNNDKYLPRICSLLTDYNHDFDI
jgi:hypothetical protein